MPHLYQSVGEVMDTPSLSGMVVWNDEQISDFVRKLGFLDAEGDTAFQIKQFLHLNQVCVGREGGEGEEGGRGKRRGGRGGREGEEGGGRGGREGRKEGE